LSESNDPNLLTGSARSIDGVHVHQALQEVAEQYSDICLSYGGHRAAAGVRIYRHKLDQFQAAFEKAVRNQTGASMLCPEIRTDGELNEDLISLHTCDEIDRLSPFGRGFEEPIFEGTFHVEQLRLVGKPAIHLWMRLRANNRRIKAIWFRAVEADGDQVPFQVGDSIKCAYRLNRSEYNGTKEVQLMVEYAEPCREVSSN
jgi:single-stranded-DNA-specific exonuclease